VVLGHITRNKRSNNRDNTVDTVGSKQQKQAIQIFTSQQQATTVAGKQ